MDWGKLIFILYICIFLVMFILKEDDQEDFIYTASIQVGLPIISTYAGTDIRSATQEVVGITIIIKDKSDNYTYKFGKNHAKDIQNVRVETGDKVTLINLIPSDSSESGELFLSSTDRRYVRNEETYLVYTKGAEEIRKRLNKVRLKPIPK